MQKVDSALATLGSMFFTELVRTSKNVCPLDRSVNKQFLVQTVLDKPKCSPTFQVSDFFATGGVAQCIPDFNPVQWREVQRFAGSRDVARRLRSVTIFATSENRKLESG